MLKSFLLSKGNLWLFIWVPVSVAYLALIVRSLENLTIAGIALSAGVSIEQLTTNWKRWKLPE